MIEEVATMVDLQVGATQRTRGSRVRWTVSAAAVALSAWIGAAGLAFGFLEYPDRLARRLPFGNPVVGGLALATVIALPFSALAVLAWRSDEQTRWAGFWSGVILVGWIVVQLVVVRELSVLHPVCAAAGAAFAYAGRHDSRLRRR